LVDHDLKAVHPAILAGWNQAMRVTAGVSNSDIIRSHLGLLVHGKSDFAAIENFKGDMFYKLALIALCSDHGNEQSLAEFKTGIDLTRPPSGKFDSNDRTCQLAALALSSLGLRGSARAVRVGRSGASQRQAQTPQDDDAGADLPGRPAHRHGPALLP
jgi:hypothetical protein